MLDDGDENTDEFPIIVDESDGLSEQESGSEFELEAEESDDDLSMPADGLSEVDEGEDREASTYQKSVEGEKSEPQDRLTASVRNQFLSQLDDQT